MISCSFRLSLEPWYPRFCDDNCLSTVSAVLGAFDLPATIHIVLRNVFETRQIHQSGSKLNPFWHIPTTVRLGAFTPETLPALLYGGTLGTCVGEGGSPLRTTNSICFLVFGGTLQTRLCTFQPPPAAFQPRLAGIFAGQDHLKSAFTSNRRVLVG